MQCSPRRLPLLAPVELEIRTDTSTPTTNAPPLRALLHARRRYPLEKGPGPMTSALVILYLVMFSLYWLWTGASPRPFSASAVPAEHLPRPAFGSVTVWLRALLRCLRLASAYRAGAAHLRPFSDRAGSEQVLIPLL